MEALALTAAITAGVAVLLTLFFNTVHISHRFGRLEERVEGLRGQVAQQSNHMTQIRGMLERLEERLGRLEERIDRLSSR